MASGLNADSARRMAIFPFSFFGKIGVSSAPAFFSQARACRRSSRGTLRDSQLKDLFQWDHDTLLS
jgi:hypothetical protein